MKSVRQFVSSYVVFAAIEVLTSLSPVRAQVPQMINHQGFVKVNGANFNGTGYFRFALVDGAGSASYWSNDGSRTNASQLPTATVPLPVVNGLYSVLLGDTSITNMTLSIQSSVFANADVRLRVWFDDGVSGPQLLAPDQRIVSTGYTMMAADVANGAIGASKLAPGSVTAPAIAAGAVGTTQLANGAISSTKLATASVTAPAIASAAVGTTQLADGAVSASKFAPASVTSLAIADGAISASKLSAASITAPAIAAGAVGNSALAADSVTGAKILDGTITDADISSAANINAGKIVGGDLQALRLKVGSDHILTGYYATIAGGYDNIASNYAATIGGGAFNSAGGDWAAIGGGYGNIASNLFVAIGGGRGNTASGDQATVAGGYGNTASGQRSTVAGGANNKATTYYAAVGGGADNTASGDRSFIGGGTANSAASAHSVAAGGELNKAIGSWGTVGGGRGNTASYAYATIGGGSSNIASGLYATIGGGSGNITTDNCTVGGGNNNMAQGYCSTVPGGALNFARDNYSFAAGYRAKAYGSGAFVWADSTEADMSSAGPNSFTVRATGGARFITGVNRQGNPMGVSLAPGAPQWTSLSDRNAKENFATVDGQEVLAKLSAMPIETWNYKAQDSSIRHMGPMAQDFYAAFGLGEDKLGIGTLDADGVAFAALKGLYELVKEKEGVIEQLKRQAASQEEELKTQKAELDELKRHNAALLTDLADLKSQVQQVNAMFKSLKNSAPQAVKLSSSGNFHQP